MLPPSFVPARPPQATMSLSHSTVSSPETMQKPEAVFFTFFASNPSFTVIFGFSRANRSTSTTEFA